LLKSYGVGVEGVEEEKEGVTGRAIIQLDQEGENCISEPLDSLPKSVDYSDMY